MEMAEIKHVVKKFEEYGMRLFTDYPTEENQHCFMVENMIVYLDKKDNSIAVSFLASSKPEQVAQNMMILSEIKDLDDIYVMESFVYDMNDKFVSGDDAHNLVKQSIEHEALKEFAKRQTYIEVLSKAKCFDC
jgi:3-methyladenine DNA glycosylase AlkC